VCDCSQLSEAEARRLVESQTDFTGGVTCGVEVYEYAHGQYGIATSSGTYSACAAALERAGLVTLQGCATSSPSCPYVALAPTAPSRIEDRFVRFACGSVRLLGISAITTTGNTATFSYERDVTHDRAVVDAVSACRLDLATEGRATRQRTARRDDQGNWSLVTTPR
jgi:hypothetical protein